MARGGRRQGQPGRSYPNRTDLNRNLAAAAPSQQPIRAASGQTYGERGRQEAAQRMMPLPEVAVPPLDAPSMRPGEPVQAGLPSGPGPGPEAVRAVGQPQDPLADLRALYAAYPHEDLLALLWEEG